MGTAKRGRVLSHDDRLGFASVNIVVKGRRSDCFRQLLTAAMGRKRTCTNVGYRPGAVLAKGEETCVKADFTHQARWGAVQHSRLPSSPSRRPINTIR